jgi:hypothetical protein
MGGRLLDRAANETEDKPSAAPPLLGSGLASLRASDPAPTRCERPGSDALRRLGVREAEGLWTVSGCRVGVEDRGWVMRNQDEVVEGGSGEAQRGSDESCPGEMSKRALERGWSEARRSRSRRMIGCRDKSASGFCLTIG